MDTNLLVSLCISLLITATLYLLVPAFFCLKRIRLTKSQIKTIVILNGAVVWLIFAIINVSLNGETRASAAVILWSSIAYLIMKKRCLVDSVKAPKQDVTPPTCDSENAPPAEEPLCESEDNNNTPPTCESKNLPLIDTHLSEGDDIGSSLGEISPSLLNSVSPNNNALPNKATKKVPNGSTIKNIALIVVSALLITSFFINISCFVIGGIYIAKRIEQFEEQGDKYQKLIQEQAKQIEQFEEQEELLSFYEEYAVCVNDEKEFYHKYGCSFFDSSSFYIYNVNAAIYYGYEPCPFCIDTFENWSNSKKK